MSREMKDSGVEWIGLFPTSWKILRNKNLFTNEKALVGNESSKLQLLSLTTQGVKKKDINAVGGKQPESFDTYQYVQKNDLIMCLFDLDVSAVFSGISLFNGMISPAYKILKCKDNVNPYFYDYWFKYIFDGRKFSHYSKNLRYTLNYDEFGTLPVVYPSMEEQQRIANFLDEKVGEIDKVIAKTKESIEEDKKLKQAIITSIVTRGLSKKGGLKVSGLEWVDLIPSDWSIQKTSRYFKLSKGLPITKDNLKESGIPVVSYGQIHAKWNSGTRMHEELKRYVDISYANDYPQCKVPIGSIIMADTSEDLDGCGNAAYNDICDNLYAGYHTITLTSSEENNKYYSYLFKTSAWRSQIRQRASGVKLFSVTQKILKETTILVPPIETQIEISNYLDEKCNNIDSIILAKESICKELEQYKKSLIYEYVTGKKEVR